MAIFWVTFAAVENRARSGGTIPVMKGRGAVGLEPLTTTTSTLIAQDAAGDWSAPRNGTVTIQADVALWVHVAAAPVAVKGVANTTVGAAFYLAANERLELTVETGDKLAVINA